MTKVSDRVRNKVRSKANIYFFSKVAVNILLIVLGAILISVFLRNMQNRTALSKQRENSAIALDTAAEILHRNEDNATSLTKIYHEGNQQILNDIDLLFSKGMFRSIIQNDDSVRSIIFTELASRVDLDYFLLMSTEGKVIIANDLSLVGMNPAVTGHMTQENVNRILRWSENEYGEITPILVKSRFGTFYFYSKPYDYLGEQYVIVIGMDATVVDKQTAQLKDASAVLGRMAAINNGFLFSIDRENDIFLYYKNGDTLLTGQNAFSAGLSQKILQDGYNGTETILGEKYYCSVKAFDANTIIVAAAKNSDILASDRYILFWSILGFSLVMIICLLYAVIVRNDFVRRAVKTDRYVLRKNSKNPIYFDKSVFSKVMPLMITGVVVMFGIAFYTQTLLELTEGIAKSDVALQEVIGRYNESVESGQVIEGYYNKSFLSTAKLLSFIVEEEPDILNAATDYYYSTFDENGNRTYLLDDEGNPLKSVGNSIPLKQLCKENDIDDIYLFDEDGHTIATSTSNWFFTISHNEEDQSYPFLEVLQGKTDAYAQNHMTNDLGEETQFFGVAFHYYTTLDESGKTKYLSQYAFEEAMAEAGVENVNYVNGITRHRSLMQIQLNDNVAAELLAPMTAEQILSTNMLEGGAIIMFDTTPEHVCLYSPVASSVGLTADELDVSSNAFSLFGYYGFGRINGNTYFLYFRYLNDYYIATAIPKASMFPARGLSAALSAGVCFVLLMILLFTVTITNKEEELLYETMSKEDEEKGLNSVIFNIVLPSGRSITTKNAAARWDNRRVTWSERSPEQKLGVIASVIIVLMFAYWALSALGISLPFGNTSMIRYILSGTWDRSLNLFALSSCTLVMTVTVVAIAVLRIPVRIITTLLGTRGETIGHLLVSIVRYGGTIGSVFYCLYLVGVDSGSLLASAGILSLVIGLGAQSLIKDIIAGIFIVFEGEFRVGDIVTISDFRGTVMDIGLRTTKIMSPEGNIKIFNNSDISGVLNMTKETSVASTIISIEYGQDIEYVEAVLAKELPKLKNKNDMIVDGPTYLGVQELKDSGVDLMIIARCAEQNIRDVRRYLNKEVLQIFYRNGINVPFPNVTLSQLDMSNRMTIEDLLAQQDEAEQKEANK